MHISQSTERYCEQSTSPLTEDFKAAFVACRACLADGAMWTCGPGFSNISRWTSYFRIGGVPSVGPISPRPCVAPHLLVPRTGEYVRVYMEAAPMSTFSAGRLATLNGVRIYLGGTTSRARRAGESGCWGSSCGQKLAAVAVHWLALCSWASHHHAPLGVTRASTDEFRAIVPHCSR